MKYDKPIRLTVTLTPELHKALMDEAVKRFGNRRGAIQFLIEEILRTYLNQPSSMVR